MHWLGKRRTTGTTPFPPLDTTERCLDPPSYRNRDLCDPVFHFSMAVLADEDAALYFTQEARPTTCVAAADVVALGARVEVMKRKRGKTSVVPAELAGAASESN